MPTLLRPQPDDLQVIAFYVGKVVFGLGLFMLLPGIMAAALGEWNELSAIVIGGSLTIAIARLTEWRCYTDKDLDWSHGMVTVAVSWLVGALLYAVPMYLSGHFASYLDAFFDSMSGLTTSGLVLIQDLDHLSAPINTLRHLSHFAGGQGIVIVVLSVLSSSTAQVGTLYVGEGREERIVPNIVRTARFIFAVAFAYLVAGTLALWVTGMTAGLTPPRALFHAFNIFMAAFDTGGFSPYSSSIAYYHSAAMELVIVVLMIAGTLSFGLHFELWRGRKREMVQNLEIRSLAITTALVSSIALVGLARAGTFDDLGPLMRKGFFTILSAHTGTGFAVNAPRLFVTDWGLIAPAAIVIAMALGGMASSTAGGIKAIRVGVTAKSVIRDIRRALAPDSAYLLATYTQRYRRIIRDDQVRSVITIVVLYLLTYFAGAIVGVFYGFPFDQAMFESTSATANVGLSIGLLSPDNPTLLKIVYIVQMWLGRLEFLTVFAFFGYLVAMARARV